MSKVSIVSCDSYNEEEVIGSVKKALGLIGFKGFNRGDVALIKPNVLGPKKPEDAVTTHPSIINAVCQILDEYGVEIQIGDSSGSVLYGGTKKAFDISGITDVARKWNANLISLESEKYVELKIDGKILKTVHTSRPVVEADHIINLPKLKTHSFMDYSGAVKNLFGIVPGGMKREYHRKAKSKKIFGELLVDICQGINPELSLMDGVYGMEGLGPTYGKVKKTGLIFASDNCFALDFIASKAIGFNPMEIESNRAAYDRELVGEIEVFGLKDVSIKYEKPGGLIRNVPSFLRLFVEEAQLPRVSADKGKCKKCWICVNSCPVNAIKKNEFPRINQKKCIQCYCCHELCPEGAIMLEDALLGKLLKIVLRRK